MKKILTLLTSCLVFIVMATAAQATPINWHSGEQHLTSPNDLYHVQFSLTEKRTVVIYTDAGSHFDAGVFLWDENKSFCEANEDGYMNSVSFNGHNQSIHYRDGYIEITLEAGDYYMTLVPLLDGEYADTMNFNNMDELIAYREGKPAMDLSQYFDGSGIFQFHVLGVDSASPFTPAVPIPASALLLVPGLAAIGMLRRKLS